MDSVLTFLGTLVPSFGDAVSLLGPLGILVWIASELTNVIPTPAADASAQPERPA